MTGLPPGTANLLSLHEAYLFFVYFDFPRLGPRKLKHRVMEISRNEHPIAPIKLAMSVHCLSEDL